MTISDYFTKWVEAYATPNKTAVQVSNCLFKVRKVIDAASVLMSLNFKTHFY